MKLMIFLFFLKSQSQIFAEEGIKTKDLNNQTLSADTQPSQGAHFSAEQLEEIKKQTLIIKQNQAEQQKALEEIEGI